MDVALYLVAAAILVVLILFALKVRRKTQDGKLAFKLMWDIGELANVNC